MRKLRFFGEFRPLSVNFTLTIFQNRKVNNKKLGSSPFKEISHSLDATPLARLKKKEEIILTPTTQTWSHMPLQ